MLLALALADGALPRIDLRVALVAAGVGALLVGANAFSSVTVMAVPSALLIVAAAQRDVAGTGSMFARPRFRTLGAWSFPFYLVHALVLTAVIVGFKHAGGAGLLGTAPGHLVVAVVALPLALAAAGVLHAGVERPLERRLRPPSAPARVDASVSS